MYIYSRHQANDVMSEYARAQIIHHRADLRELGILIGRESSLGAARKGVIRGFLLHAVGQGRRSLASAMHPINHPIHRRRRRDLAQRNYPRGRISYFRRL